MLLTAPRKRHTAPFMLFKQGARSHYVTSLKAPTFDSVSLSPTPVSGHSLVEDLGTLEKV